MSQNTVNEQGNEGGSVTVALPDCIRGLYRHRPGHPAAQHISNLIEQLKNYDRNPVLLKPMILMSAQRIEEARPGFALNAEDF